MSADKLCWFSVKQIREYIEQMLNIESLSNIAKDLWIKSLSKRLSLSNKELRMIRIEETC